MKEKGKGLTQNMLKDEYKHLLKEPGPRMLVKALELYGVREFAGELNNPMISGWCDELQDVISSDWLKNYLKEDSTPWCGLFMAICARRAGKPVPRNVLSRP